MLLQMLLVKAFKEGLYSHAVDEVAFAEGSLRIKLALRLLD